MTAAKETITKQIAAGLLTKQETAARLRICVRTLESHIAKNTLPHVRLGRRVLVPEAALDAWISGRVTGGGI